MYQFEVDQVWCYRGEGNQNLVISFPQETKVLRLTKLKSISESDGCARNYVLKNFSLNVMKRLLGQFVPPVDVIFIEKENLEKIFRRLQQFRPESRKNECFTIASCALLLPDCAFLRNNKFCVTTGPTVAVEIKPKMGYFTSDHATCRYRLMQRKKLNDGKIKSKSGYCPIDLFSGNLLRMKRALRALLVNPQNNFRMFKDGTLVYGEETNSSIENVISELFQEMQILPERTDGASSDLCDLLCNVLTKALLHKSSDEDGLRYTVQFCKCHGNEETESCGNGLSVDCVLGRLLTVQKLDTLGVQKIYPLYEEFKEVFQCHADEEINRWLYDDYKDDSTWNNLDFQQQEAVLKIRNFLLAATCKDCSIMITLSRFTGSNECDDDEDHLFVLKKDGKKLQISISVLDLDTKPHSRIEKYYKDELHLLTHYSRD